MCTAALHRHRCGTASACEGPSQSQRLYMIAEITDGDTSAELRYQDGLQKIGLLRLQGVCHRDLKLENTLLDGSEAPRLKICDFGYSKVCGLFL